MFVRIIRYSYEKDQDGVEHYVTKGDGLYECDRVFKNIVPRPKGDQKDLSLTLELDGSHPVSVLIDREDYCSIYFMNDDGKTIDTIQYTQPTKAA